MIAIDAWAQPANGRLREKMPEVVRLLEKSGTAELLDRAMSIDETVAHMDAAGVDKLMLAARNVPHVEVITVADVNPVALAAYDKVLMTVGAVKLIEERLQ